ncbi:hypothetical protein [Weissella bombi]|uniref:Uncharacterized protein n=1 Tax=Weissella bombi TaxID=1505725 RepID=A0A1C4C7M8_9LACO|nr:hypothetical protein [Weissella bombi]SCC15101.1 hypothetical protein GA0061074_1265 [Weissella bombi]
MPYLTYDEYKGFNFAEIDESDFKKILTRAELAINSITQFRLMKEENSLLKLPNWMQTQFKQAVALQVEYIAKSGIETAADAREQANISSSSIGSTSISMNSGTARSANDTSLYISPDTMNILASLGLLYTGVDYVR